MLRLAAFLSLLGLGFLGLGKSEQNMLYHFSPQHISPAAAGVPQLQECTILLNGQRVILWMAPPQPSKPVILYFHGNAGHLADRAWRFRKLIARGHGVIAMGYPGSSGSDGTPSQKAILKAAKAVYQYRQKLVGDAPMVLYGESLGTGVAVLLNHALARQKQALPAAIVLEAPYTSIPDVAALHYPGLKWLTPLMRDRYPSKNRVGTGIDHILILHGSEDQLIPVQMGRALFERIKSNHKVFYMVQGAGHADMWQPASEAVLFEFLEQF
ncbi:MAG: hypothetical protein CSA68_11995 [Rhodobacterales bacterium]|nr:MAG: hypothetical protein CSA68_11995 [Rhodobacterales bacterium]